MSETHSGPYTDEELHNALQYVASRTQHGECPFCKTNQWTFENVRGYEMPVPRVGYITLDNSVEATSNAYAIPIFTLTCNDCGFVRHHNIPMIKARMAAQSQTDGNHE